MTVPLAPLRHDEGGVSTVEFALISPVLMAVLFGMFDLGHTLYATSMIDGAMQEVARSSTIEGATIADLDAQVTRAVERVLPSATITFTRRSYSDFADVERPEDYDDLNGSNLCDNGESFEDVNGNGVWDADRGTLGNGGAREAVLYKVTATYDRIFPVPEFLGFPQSTSITGQTVLRNQPYQRMASAPVTTPTCP